MQGKVVAVNSNRGMVAVETNTGYTIFELLGDYEIELGDVIAGNLETHEGEALLNITKQEKMDVYIQGIHCSPEGVREMLQ